MQGAAIDMRIVVAWPVEAALLLAIGDTHRYPFDQVTDLHRVATAEGDLLIVIVLQCDCSDAGGSRHGVSVCERHKRCTRVLGNNDLNMATPASVLCGTVWVTLSAWVR